MDSRESMTAAEEWGKWVVWRIRDTFCMLVGMHFSRQVQYGLCGIFDLAYHGAGEPVRVQTIGERQQIPYRFLEQIFQKMRKAGLVRGKRGPGGGYVLSRPPEEINLRELIEAIEGPFGATDFGAEEGANSQFDSDSSESPESPESRSVHRPEFLFRDLAERVAATFEKVAVADLCREAVRQNVQRDLPDGFDYQI